MSQASKARATFLALTLTSLMVLSVIPVQAPVAADPIKKVAWFEEGETQVAMTFNSAGIDTTSAKLSFQTGITVSNVSFKVDTQENSNEYPSNVTIDINGDGRHEWRFDGLGYGALGKQYLFILDDEEQNLTANLTMNKADGENTSASIRLPYGAQVDEAELEVEVKGVTIAIECAAGSSSCNNVDNDPIYSLQTAFEEEGWQVTQVSFSARMDSLLHASGFRP